MQSQFDDLVELLEDPAVATATHAVAEDMKTLSVISLATEGLGEDATAAVSAVIGYGFLMVAADDLSMSIPEIIAAVLAARNSTESAR